MTGLDLAAAPVRVLVTGAGGPAAVSVLKSLRSDRSVTLIAADMDPWAAGLYLVPAAERALIPAGLAAGFADALLQRCLAMRIDIVIPTVDSELRPLAAARARFAAAGAELLLAPDRALDLTLAATDPASWAYPVIVKPRTGSGSRGISLVASARELGAMDCAGEFLVQEYLPGQEYSIDVLADRSGHIIAAVPRVREKVDSGVSVAGRTVRDPELEQFGTAVARCTGLTYIANVQCRRDRLDRPALLEVNPRAPGALPLTVASGVDMPRLALDSLRGRRVPEHVDFREIAMVRFLEERFIEPGEVSRVAA
jgi:carbamoyl-phosphate synthase large subunit